MTERPLTLFVDWYSIWPGAVTYDSLGGAHYCEGPRGLRLAVQPAQKSKVVLHCEYPWEEILSFGSVLPNPAGGWMLWYGVMCFPEAVEMDEAYGVATRKEVMNVCYAESEDGLTWHKPMLGLHEFAGSTENNIVYPDCVEAAVFVDADGNYRMVHHLPFPQPTGETAHYLGTSISPDGIHWTDDLRSLVPMYCDTQNVGAYDPARQLYTACVRYARGSRRAMAITEGPEPAEMPYPQIVLEPDSQDDPAMDIYTNAYCRHPEVRRTPQPVTYDGMGRLESVELNWAQDMHFMFPAMFDRSRDMLDVQLAVSRDGKQWSRPERKPIIAMGEPGSGEECGIYPAPGIHVLQPGLWGVLYGGVDHGHNEWFQPALKVGGGHYRWALWPENRLVALQADDEGECTIFLPAFSGADLRVNFQTERGGWIRLELGKSEGYWPPAKTEPLPGFSFADCDPLTGDALNHSASWQGITDLSGLKKVDVVRVKMSRAKLFAIYS